MILVIDIGNTNIVFGCMEDKKLLFSARLGSDVKKTPDEYCFLLKGILDLHQIPISAIEGGIISSVVPVLRDTLAQTAHMLTGKNFLIVGIGLKTGLNVRMETELGADLVTDAVAALAKYPLPCAVIDMGTATTCFLLDRSGTYVGGLLMPGLRVSANALSGHTAQLPYVSLEAPPSVLGKKTVTAMQAGLIYGHAAMLDGIVDRVEEYAGEPVTAVITGGLARVVVPHCRRQFTYDENLLLDGLAILYEKNTRKGR